ncbi:LOW QUALITY PROTEIN: sugar transporter [Aspergillus udagawae]|uniref:Sugar transporter n=1 Tax=Aspergillus udagawae TaxID=91492 RepID=A0A8H3SCL2_9EURO|nr:LOW QUALITY PROTEIN: sugar transporter [Aspergillus udagawae]
MFQGPRMPYRIILGIMLQALQQLTGANNLFYYGTVVFNGAGIKYTYVTQINPWRCQFRHNIRSVLSQVTHHWGHLDVLFVSVGHFFLNVHDPPQTPGAGKAMVVFACFFIT